MVVVRFCESWVYKKAFVIGTVQCATHPINETEFDKGNLHGGSYVHYECGYFKKSPKRIGDHRC